MPEIEFIPVASDSRRGFYCNVEYLPFVFRLFQKYESLIVDDGWIEEGKNLFEFMISEINEMYPFFLVILYNRKPAGAVWITHIHGNSKAIYSCQIHGAVERKYFGRKTMEIADRLFEALFVTFGVERVQAEIDEANHSAISFMKRTGFTREGLLRHAGLKGGKPINHYVFSLLKGEFINGKR